MFTSRYVSFAQLIYIQDTTTRRNSRQMFPGVFTFLYRTPTRQTGRRAQIQQNIFSGILPAYVPTGRCDVLLPSPRTDIGGTRIPRDWLCLRRYRPRVATPTSGKPKIIPLLSHRHRQNTTVMVHNRLVPFVPRHGSVRRAMLILDKANNARAWVRATASRTGSL